MARRKGSRNRFNSNRDVVAMKQRRQDKRAVNRGEDRDDKWAGTEAHTQFPSADPPADLPECTRAW